MLLLNPQQNCFRILNLSLKEHKIFKDLDIEFADINDFTEKQPYISLIIGSNGTGKSNLLRAISDIFRELYSLKTTGKRSNSITGYFKIEYLYNGQIYSFGNFSKMNSIFSVLTKHGVYPAPNFMQGDQSISFEQAPMPEAILASSLMVTDKFFNDTKNTLPYYKYLGVRTSRNQSGTKTYIRKAVEMLIDALGTPNEILTRFKLGDLLETLGFKRQLYIQYKLVYQKHFFNPSEPLTLERFKGFFENYKKYTNRETAPWGITRYEKIKNNSDLLNSIVKRCNAIVRLGHIDKAIDSKSKVLRFEVINGSGITQYDDLIKELTLLDLLRAPEMIFYKDGKSFTYQESSSGEQHIITSLIGIMSQIKDNSLVLLDEPEISLHPNWQMKYINDFLVKTFEHYPSCQFIVSTHSHFLVSDVKSECSKLVGLTTDKDGIKVTYPTPEDTFGWSAEQVLYKVFNVKTTRNHYLEMEMRELLYLISQKSTDRSRIRELLNNVKVVSLDKNDPLNPIIKEAEKYLKE